MKSSSPQTIFIADDNPENLKVLSDILEAEGYRTRASLSGTAMLESISHETPDLIVLDIHMPEHDGYEICLELKKNPATAEIPVIFCSALNETFNIVQAFEAGGVDYITKPFRTREVLARIRTHIELREKQRSLELTLQQLQATQQHLIHSEKMSSLGTLLAGIAHEINNPVNYIINSSEAFETDFEDILRLLSICDNETQSEQLSAVKNEIEYPLLLQEMRDLLQGIHSGAIKIHGIVKSLQSLAADPSETKQHIDPGEEIRRALLIIEPQLDHSMHLSTEIDELPAIYAQPGRLSQAVLHIAHNALLAVQANPESKTREIRVTGRVEDEKIRISIADSGPGIPDEHLPKVLDPFYTTREPGEGIGLGLTISHQIISDLGGSLHIESGGGLAGGTTIVIFLPVVS
ncbi:hybrid sensor histidine kinase/response regulator [Spirochaeta dissipatitropha]